MQEVCVISYQLNNCDSGQKTAIQRALNGHLDYSNNSVYKYKRKGLLEEIPHKILGKGAIMALPKDSKRIVSILKNNNAWCVALILESRKKIFP